MAHTVSASSQTQINLPFPIPFFGGLGGNDEEPVEEVEVGGDFGEIEWSISDLKGKDIKAYDESGSHPYQMLIGHDVKGTLFAKHKAPYSRRGFVTIRPRLGLSTPRLWMKLRPLKRNEVWTFTVAQFQHQDFAGYQSAFIEKLKSENRLAQAQDDMSEALYDQSNPDVLKNEIANETTAASEERLADEIDAIEQQHSSYQSSQEDSIRQQYAENREAEIEKRVSENYAAKYQADLNAIRASRRSLKTSEYFRARRCIKEKNCMMISKGRAEEVMEETEPKLKALDDKRDDLRTANDFDKKTIKREVNNDSNYSFSAEDDAVTAMITADTALETEEIALAESTEATMLTNELAALDTRDFQAEADARVAELEYNIGNFEGFVAEQNAIILDYENSLSLCDKEFPAGTTVQIEWKPEEKAGFFRALVPDEPQEATVAVSGTVSCGWLPAPEEEA